MLNTFIRPTNVVLFSILIWNRLTTFLNSTFNESFIYLSLNRFSETIYKKKFRTDVNVCSQNWILKTPLISQSYSQTFRYECLNELCSFGLSTFLSFTVKINCSCIEDRCQMVNNLQLMSFLFVFNLDVKVSYIYTLFLSSFHHSTLRLILNSFFLIILS